MRSARNTLSILFFLLPLFASASLEITKVEYDAPGTDKGREWVEVTNTGPHDVSLEGYRFFEGGVHHKLSLVQGSWTLKASSSAIIADNAEVYKEEHPHYTGTLIDSAFSLSNTGESLALKRGGVVVASTTYVAATKEEVRRSPTSTPKTRATSTAADAQGDATPPLFAWVLGLFGIMVLGVAGALMVPRSSRKETVLSAEEFEIQ